MSEGWQFHRVVGQFDPLMHFGAELLRFTHLVLLPALQVAPFDAALPGTLPCINRGVVRQAVRAGLALGGDVQRVSAFERKHYMYADLPHGYQITQNQVRRSFAGCVRWWRCSGSS